jgi:hypothetical protein
LVNADFAGSVEKLQNIDWLKESYILFERLNDYQLSLCQKHFDKLA